MQINPPEGQGFLKYPRFLQMILNHLIPNLPQHPQRLTLTPMTQRIFIVFDIPVNEPVQVEAVANEDEQDFRLNMDDFNDEAMNSIIHEAKGNVVDTSSRKRVKSKARKPRRKSVRDPPFGSVLGKRTLIDESSDSDREFILVPKARKLMSASIAAAHSSQGVEDATFVESLLVTPPSSRRPSPVITPTPKVTQSSAAGTSQTSDSERITYLESQVIALQNQVDVLVNTDAQRQLVLQTQEQQIVEMKLMDGDVNDPSGNIEGDHQYANVNPISRVQGESSTLGNIEGTKKDSGVNEEILLLEFFQTKSDVEEDDAEKLECLDDIDELFNDVEDDMIDIEDDVIPEFSNEGVTNTMDSVEDVTKPDDTAQSKMDNEADTTRSVSPKTIEEHVMYRNIGMTREQWKEVVNCWKKELPKSPIQPAQKERYVNKERCVGRIISWFYDEEIKLFALKRFDGVQYLKPRIKYFNTLPRCEMNGLATKPLIKRSKFGLANVIAKLISKEGGSGKYEKLKPQKGKIVKLVDHNTGIVTWKYKFNLVRAVKKIPLKKIPQDFIGNMKWWYVDVNTSEARVEDKDNKIIVRFMMQQTTRKLEELIIETEDRRSSYCQGVVCQDIDTQLLAHLVQQDRDARQRLDSHDTLLKNQQSAFHHLKHMVEDIAKSLKDRQGGPSSSSSASVMTVSVRSVGEKKVAEDDPHSSAYNISSPEEFNKIDWKARFAEIDAKMAEEQVDEERVVVILAEKAEEKKKGAEMKTLEIDLSRVPYPERLMPHKQAREHGHFLDMFKQLKVNLPLIDTLLRTPKYGKFLKDLLSNKKTPEEVFKVSLSQQCSAVVQNKLPEKLEDLGCFTIPCLLGSLPLHHALVDLGASINLKPYSLYKQLDLGEPQATRMSIYMADRSLWKWMMESHSS
ncbi:hypothetical protein L1987_83391 [Smallanthus sonchifolius]|uniref:Uncharacterized protein n=1 Tax=Smallanthus sonchifolius TaxID=185202 RepID=A0ACB8YCP4_9ASTR|nr:hypothetical protein L1987_83391 [Smallanthus sonchifolius]